MKRIGLGIAIFLFGILLELSAPGYLYYFSWLIGIIGLIVVVTGYVSNEDGASNR